MAALAAAGIAAGGSVLGAITGGKGAKKAAKIAAATADKNRAFAQDIYNQNVTRSQPTVDRGNAAGTNINALLGLGGDPTAANDALAAWRGSTGYQSGLDQGLKAANQGYAARGALESGAAQKALVKYGTDYSNSNFTNYYNMLNGQQNAGLSAQGAISGAGAQLVSNVTDANNTAGSAAANGAIYGATATQNALSGIASAGANYLGSQSSYNALSAFPSYYSGTPAYSEPISTMSGYTGYPRGFGG